MRSPPTRPNLATLRTLHVGNNRLDDAGALALASSFLGNLTTLTAFDNAVGARGEEALGQRFGDHVHA